MMNEFCLGNKFLRKTKSLIKDVTPEQQQIIDAKLKLENEISFMLSQFGNNQLY